MRNIKNVFLYGSSGVGKSTIINKIVNSVSCSIGGFKEEHILNGEEKIFNIISMLDGEIKGTIGEFKYIDGSYKLISMDRTFNVQGVDILMNSLNKDLIIMDELGRLEDRAEEFKAMVNKVLNSNKVVLGVIKPFDTRFLKEIKSREDVVTIEVTLSNREYIEDEIKEILKKSNINFSL